MQAPGKEPHTRRAPQPQAQPALPTAAQLTGWQRKWQHSSQTGACLPTHVPQQERIGTLAARQAWGLLHRQRAAAMAGNQAACTSKDQPGTPYAQERTVPAAASTAQQACTYTSSPCPSMSATQHTGVPPADHRITHTHTASLPACCHTDARQAATYPAATTQMPPSDAYSLLCFALDTAACEDSGGAAAAHNLLPAPAAHVPARGAPGGSYDGRMPAPVEPSLPLPLRLSLLSRPPLLLGLRVSSSRTTSSSSCS